MKSTTQKLLHVLSTSNEVLPIDSSPIAYEIILMCMSYYYDEKELPLKVIFLSKHFTEMGARSHVSRLVKGNWIEVIKSDQDLRIKIIKPTPKLINIFAKFVNLIND